MARPTGPAPPAGGPAAGTGLGSRRRTLGLVVFLLVIATLATMAAVSLLVPAPRVAGLPDDAEVRATAGALQGRLPMRAGNLRFRSALTGEAAPGATFGAAEAHLADRAAAALGRAAARLRGDARLQVALAHLDLLRQRPGAAERRYRAVTDLGLKAPEARLGLGLALALQARTESDPLRARGLRLEALAQLAAVDRGDPAHAVALYDRALLLAELGRGAEAAAVAREYLAFDPAGPWASRLRRELAPAAP